MLHTEDKCLTRMLKNAVKHPRAGALRGASRVIRSVWLPPSPIRWQGTLTVDTSMSKAIAALVRLGLEAQESRKAEFFKKLKANFANDDPKQLDQLLDEFRTLILGR